MRLQAKALSMATDHRGLAAASSRPSDGSDQPRFTRADLYRAVWRWHFYAGLFVLPFLITLAVTGALYLFRTEIEALVHSDLKRVEALETAQLQPSATVAAAGAAFPGTILRYVPPATPASAAEIGIEQPTGRVAVYVNPYDGSVLGSLPDRGSVMWIIRQVHSLAFFGPVANAVVEIAAGWSILLVATGIYLWWPRGQSGGVVSVRGDRSRRIFWRDLHAVTGIVAGVFIVFLSVTGMPWSIVWGAQVNQLANGTNYGYPSGVRVNVPVSDEHLAHHGPTAWSLERSQVPVSNADGAPLGLDAAVAKFEALGLHRGYSVSLPKGDTGVYTASVYPNDVAQQRVVHLDQYSGAVLIDVGFDGYGPAAKALEWGINVHLGQEYGRANQIVLALACLAIVVLCVSAAVMWWKRRPARALGVPPEPRRPGAIYGVAAILMIGGVIFPLVGATLVGMAIVDRLAVWGRASRGREENLRRGV